MENNNNNICEGLIQTKTTIIPIIRTLRPSKDQQTLIQKKPDLSRTVMKASGIFTMPGDDEIGQHIIPINKTVPQDVFIPRRK